MIILATDLDRTLLPDGPYPDDKSLDALFGALTNIAHVLVYVTGRNLDMVLNAIEKYNIPIPDFLIAEVGTSMFVKKDNVLIPEKSWSEYIMSHEQKWNRENIVNAIGTKHNLTLQEPEKQNAFKISYYLPHHANKTETISHINTILRKIGVDANVLWSVDPLADSVGLIDVLPKTATKATALEFLRKQKDLSKDEVIYCGDSGNDILPLTSGYYSILVNNAPKDVKKTVSEKVAQKGETDLLYVAIGTHEHNGNYASGIIEGLLHFGFIK